MLSYAPRAMLCPFLTCALESYFLCIYQTHLTPDFWFSLANENHQQESGKKMGKLPALLLIMLQ